MLSGFELFTKPVSRGRKTLVLAADRSVHVFTSGLGQVSNASKAGQFNTVWAALCHISLTTVSYTY